MARGKLTPRSISVRCLIILFGTIMAAFGCAAYVCANLGSDPVTALVQGIGKQLNLNFGVAMNIFNIVFFVFVLIFNRKMIHFGTAIYAFLLGTFCNFFISVLGNMMGPEPSIVVRSIVLILGVVTLGLGLGIYQSAELGAGPVDAFNQTMSAWTKFPLKYERIAFDVVMVVLGFLLGGVVFVGTILGMFAVGPIMAPTITKLAPVIGRWAGSEPVGVQN